MTMNEEGFIGRSGGNYVCRRGKEVWVSGICILSTWQCLHRRFGDYSVNQIPCVQEYLEQDIILMENCLMHSSKMEVHIHGKV